MKKNETKNMSPERKMKKTAFMRIMSLLGFTSCTTLGGDIPAMYGSPYIDFKASGTVQNEAGIPVKGIKVIMYENTDYAVDSVYTDQNGKYSFDEREFTYTGEIQGLRFMDEDGQDNGGEFKTKDIPNSEMDIVQTEKGKDWYEGRFESNLTVVLDKKGDK